jgi:MFS family permease
LFPLLHASFGVSYVELGSLLTIFYLLSGTCQAFAGIFVDRYGARPVLACGMTLLATSFGLFALAGKFWMLYPLVALAGLGNGVFHPADLSVLSHHVSKSRLGRGYSVHAAAGRAGFAAGPMITGSIAVLCGWRVALIVACFAGLAMAFAFFSSTRFIHEAHHARKQEHVKISYHQLLKTPAILLAFGYFFFTVAAGSGFQAFSSVSFVEFFHVPLATAAAVLSAYFIGSAVGMLVGGMLADHTPHHVVVAVTGLTLCAFCMLVIAANILPLPLIMLTVVIASFCEGITAPSRDILVKGAAPPGATGRVFGFVYSGVDSGATLAPLAFGLLVDAQAWQALFAGVSVLYLIGIPFVIPIGKRQIKAA